MVFILVTTGVIASNSPKEGTHEPIFSEMVVKLGAYVTQYYSTYDVAPPRDSDELSYTVF